MANILAVKQDLCRKPFDLKIDDVRFVGYPMSLDPSKSKPGAHQIISFNITFVLRVCVKYFTHFSMLSCDVYFIQGNFCIRFCLLPTLFFKSALFSYCKQTFCWHLGTVNITCILMSCWLNCSCSWNMPGMYLSLLFNFQANVTSSVIQCYTDLVKQITVAIHHEEERCQYLSSQAKIMLAVHDEVAAMPEGEGTCHFRVQN